MKDFFAYRSIEIENFTGFGTFDSNKWVTRGCFVFVLLFLIKRKLEDNREKNRMMDDLT